MRTIAEMRADAKRDREVAAGATPGPYTFSADPHDDRPDTVEVCDLANDAWVIADGPLSEFQSDGQNLAHNADPRRVTERADDLEWALARLDEMAKALRVIAESEPIGLVEYERDWSDVTPGAGPIEGCIYCRSSYATRDSGHEPQCQWLAARAALAEYERSRGA